jgi:pantothenate kinase type III
MMQSGCELPLQAYWLLIDAGNTRLKLFLWEDGRLEPVLLHSVSTMEIRGGTAPGFEFLGDWAVLIEQLLEGSHGACRGMVWSSVVRPFTARFAGWSERVQGHPRWSGRVVKLDHQLDLGFRLDYRRPETIGPDRLACLAGLLGQDDASNTRCGIAIDMGSALTLDGLDRRKCFSGGVIAPGLQAGLEALRLSTPDLPAIRLPDAEAAALVPGVGGSTESAMLAGAIWGFAGLVECLVRQRLAAWDWDDEPVQVVLTGGNAALMRPYLEPQLAAIGSTISVTLDSHLLCRGLRYAGQRLQ